MKRSSRAPQEGAARMVKMKRLCTSAWCVECKAKINIGDDFYRQEGNGSAEVCVGCSEDWLTLLTEHRVTGIQVGSLKSRVLVLAGQDEGGDRIPDFIQRIMVRWVGIIERWIAERSDEVEELPQPVHVLVSAENASVNCTLASRLILAFEVEMDALSSDAPDREHCFNVSQAQRELCKHRHQLLGEMAQYLRSSRPLEGSTLEWAWGHLLCRIQLDLDPDNETTPGSFRDIEGWVLWAESFISAHAMAH